ncbi:MAG: KAP family NTPase, partial [Anaerolineales bacterium]|nr:KAP family NTPase [Anaerolineales bacterium]
MSETSDKFELLTFHPVDSQGDRLGYRDYAETIAEMLTDLEARHNGLTIGIFGDWGAGKSSVLRMIGDEFAQRNRQWQFCKVLKATF